MKKKSPGKSGKDITPARTTRNIKGSPALSGRKPETAVVRKASTVVSPLPGLTKKTRDELVALAKSMGITVGPDDRRIDLIEKVRNKSAEKQAPARQKATPRKKESSNGQGESPRPASPAPIVHRDLPLPSPGPASSDRSARGWKDFQDIPYEPVRRERGHYVTLLPVTPFRIIAFFAFDQNDTVVTERIAEAGLVLKIRDITSSVLQGKIREDAATDHVFDIMIGMANRWSIPLWTAHRWLEAWLGFYENGTFRVLAQSKMISTPKGGPSPRMGTLFHLKESLQAGFFPMEEHWRDSLSRFLIKLPTSHELPFSHRKP